MAFQNKAERITNKILMIIDTFINGLVGSREK